MGRPRLYDRMLKVPLTQRQLDALQATAVREGVSVRAVVRRAIEAYTEPRPRRRKRRVAA